MLRRVIYSIAMLFAVGVASAQVNFQDVTTDELRGIATNEKKLVFIDVYATWCPPCKTMERDVFSREDVGEFMSKHFVSAKYDIEKLPGKTLASEYGIRSIPTYLVFDVEGNLLGRMQGAMSAEEFIKNLEQAIK